MRLLMLLAGVGLFFGVRHYLASRQPASHPRPVIGGLAKKIRDVVDIPDNVAVSSRKGVVTLKGGPMPKEDADRALAAVLAVPGVHEVRNYVQLTS